MIKKEPSVLLVAARWWPLSARLSIALLRHGCRVQALCPVGHPLTHVDGIQALHAYSGLDSFASLRRALTECRPDIVVPCDDGVVAQLHALHAACPELRALIEGSVGPSDAYPVLESRYRLLSTAIELGIRVPTTRQVRSEADLVDWQHHVASSGVLKVDGAAAGGTGVRVTHSLAEMREALDDLRHTDTVTTTWKRMLIDRDPLSLWRRSHPGERDITLQAFVEGRPANTMMACWRGTVLAQSSVVVVASEGQTGAATVVRRIEDVDMAEAATRLAARLELTGFYGLDFMIEASSGLAHLIELNPRCTQLGHVEFPVGGSLAGAFAAALRGEPPPAPKDPVQATTIAIFPQALSGATSREMIETSHHDVPWDEPRLVSELMLAPWPQRQWVARLYHALRPLTRSEHVAFEEVFKPSQSAAL